MPKSPNSTLHLPGPTERHVIVGRTGSGKTVAALWQLSLRDYDVRPWIIFDFKTDDNIAALEAMPLENVDRGAVTELPLTAEVPTLPGLYVIRPFPDDQDGVNEIMWKIWGRGNTGVYVDEGYMIGKSPAFRALLTQGRSKRVPMIVLSQRPVWMDRFVWSEADFYQAFHLNHQDDVRTVRQFLHSYGEEDLAEYHSLWYDVGRNQTVTLKPVPPLPSILAIFKQRLEVIYRRAETEAREARFTFV